MIGINTCTPLPRSIVLVILATPAERPKAFRLKTAVDILRKRTIAQV